MRWITTILIIGVLLLWVTDTQAQAPENWRGTVAAYFAKALVDTSQPEVFPAAPWPMPEPIDPKTTPNRDGYLAPLPDQSKPNPLLKGGAGKVPQTGAGLSGTLGETSPREDRPMWVATPTRVNKPKVVVGRARCRGG